MKKNLKLFTEFFYKNKIKALALVIIIISTGIIMCTTLAEIDYQFHSLSYFQREELSKADYVSIYSCLDDYYTQVFVNDSGSVDVNSLNDSYSKAVEADIYKQIEQFSAVDKVYSYTNEFAGQNLYNDSPIQLMFSNVDTYQFFEYDLSDGCWFWDTEQTSEYPNAVVCGSIFENVEVGSDIEIIYLTNPYKIHVIGKVEVPYQHVEFTANYSSSVRDYSTIFFLDDELSFNTFGSTVKRYPSDAIVQYKSDASDEEIEECRAFYKSVIYSMGGSIPIGTSVYLPSDQFIDWAYEHINSNINYLFTHDFLFCGIAVFMTIILSVLMIRSKRNEYNIYRLCGASKRKTVLISFAGIWSIAVVSGIVCSGYMLVYSYMISHGAVSVSSMHYRFDWNCYAIMWFYLLIVSVISSIIPFIMLIKKKVTLITLYHQK